MTVKKKERLRLEISDVAFGGKGIARLDDFVIFVDHGVIGDVLDVRVTRKKKNYAEARILEIITPSPHRVEAPCPYSGQCGGCKWQFLDYEKQLEYKHRHVVDALERPGLVDGEFIYPTLAADPALGYRNKMEFSCSDRRWLSPMEMDAVKAAERAASEGAASEGIEAGDINPGDINPGDIKPGDINPGDINPGNINIAEIDRGFALGLHVPGTFYKVLDINACLLQPDRGNDILADIRSFIRDSGLPVYGLRSHEGFWRFVMLRHSSFYDQWMVNIITSRPETQRLLPLGESLCEKYPNIVSVLNNVNSRKSSVAVGEYEILLAGKKNIVDRIGDLEFEISANSFFQTNTRQAEVLYKKAAQYADLSGDETLLDLYCGAGTISSWLAGSVKKVIGIEVSESAIADAKSNARLSGIDNVTFVAGDMKEALPRINEKVDAMIIDPPRAGMHKDVVKQVLEMAPPKIVYVSCNPATMARDLILMKDAYRVVEAQPVDMFPHTWHIESVVKLEAL